MIKMAQEVTIDIKFEGQDQNQQDILVFKLPTHTSWQDLQAMLKAQFDCDAISVFYIDTEGDFISVSSNEELKMAFQMATKCRNTLVLKVKDTSPETAVWTIDDAVLKKPEPDNLPDIQPTDKRNENYLENMMDDSLPQPELFHQPDILKTSEHVLFPPDDIPDDSALFSGGGMAEEKVVMDTKIDNATGETISHSDMKLEESESTETGNPEVQKIEIKRDEETGTAHPKLKTDLRQEIVKDVTRKTVKQVLKGLDGAVIHSLQGTPIIPPVLDDSTADSKDPTSSHRSYILSLRELSVISVKDQLLVYATNVDHVFLKLRKPARLGKRTVILKNTLYKVKQGTTTDPNKKDDLNCPSDMPGPLEDFIKTKMESRLQERTARKQEKLRKREEKIVEKQRKKEEKLKRRLECHQVEPDQECDVTVELQAPELPGRYQSHWKMYNDGVQFGHRVWCEIQVEPKEVLEAIKEDSLKFVKTEETQLIKEEKTIDSEEKTVMENVPILLPEPVKVELPDQSAELIERSTSVIEEKPQEASPPLEEAIKQDEIEKDLSSAVAQLKLDSASEERGQDLMSFEMVDYTQRMTPKISQTATPTNTPLDISPPKSPAPELDNKVLSSSSSVELVNAEHEEEEQHQINPLFVKEFMNKFQVPTPVDDDIESISTISDDDSSLSEDDDFLIVPLPACFDFSKPMTRSAIVNDNLSDDNDVDDNHNNIPSAFLENLSIRSCRRQSMLPIKQQLMHTLPNGSGKFTSTQSTWKPKEEKWTPKENTFVPPKSDWTPPKDTWKPPSQGISNLSSTSSSKSPMGKLVEMGFCNRDLNQELLKKHNDDVEAVVQDLLSTTDNDWWNRRH
ncbi:hypothetical protein KUTeg_001417 [Tegillarca granosa]|uniref:PB1 domain-containing protein n=1 Tax=Tegillarca granosa TaxID=220873 RepID=A0ABQ9FVR9_TEGGR|nr:hypothetical protein KUTeg_001417 [Tegillarca granosa]